MSKKQVDHDSIILPERKYDLSYDMSKHEFSFPNFFRCVPKNFNCSKSILCVFFTFKNKKTDIKVDYSDEKDNCSKYRENSFLKYDKEYSKKLK